MTRQQLLAAAREARTSGAGYWLSAEEAIVVGFAGLMGAPLHPFSWDDSAVILRARELLDEGLDVAEAVRTARDEAATWGIG